MQDRNECNPPARHAWRRFSHGLMGAMAWISAAALPAWAAAPGDKITNSIRLGAVQIPLPEGEWTVAGTGRQPFEMPAIGAFGTIENVVLFLRHGNEVVAVLEANANALPVNDGWGRTQACIADRQLHLLTRYKSGWQTGCIFVTTNQISLDSAGPAAWSQARDFARKENLTLPANWITAGFRSSDRHDLIDARYHFSPALFLGAAAPALDKPAEWTGEAVKADRLRESAVQAVIGWADNYDAFVDRGLVNQLPASGAAGPTGLMPEAAAYTGATARVDAKLRELDALHRQGRLKWDAYLEQSKAALKETPVVSAEVPMLSNAVRKNISFRTFGTVVDYMIGYMVTANHATSTGIALSINATDSVWFVLNDQYWDDYYARLNTHDSERLVDFTYIGGGSGA
ncbi:MAG: DUF2061 domain-containing protein [Acetobacteraceae bacterium]